MLLGPFKDKRDGASGQFSAKDFEGLNSDQGLELSIQRVEMGRSMIGNTFESGFRKTCRWLALAFVTCGC
jgi:hypothetical protein